MEMRRRLGATFSVKRFAEQVYKFFGFQVSGLKTRLLGVRDKSWNVIVFKNGVVKEAVV